MLRYDYTGRWYSRSDKQYNVTVDDAVDLCIITINVLQIPDSVERYTHTFSVIPPISSSCLSNYFGISQPSKSDEPENSIGLPVNNQINNQEIGKQVRHNLLSSYVGTMIVMNATNSDIKNVTVSHTCKKFYDTTTSPLLT